MQPSPSLTIKFRALLPMTGDPVENGHLVIERGTVKEINSGGPEPSGAEVLDLSDHLLLPGFVNAHCHLSLSSLKGRVPRSQRFTDWVRKLLQENSGVDQDQRVRDMQAGAGEMLRSGVTTLADYLGAADLIEEVSQFPFRQVLFLETLGFHADTAQSVTDRVRSILQNHGAGDGRVRLGIAPHAPYSVSPVLFAELRKLADRYHCPFSSHVAEFAEEGRFLKEGGGEMRGFLEERGVYNNEWIPPGKTPVGYLDSLAVLDSMTAVHLNHVEGDLDLLASRNVRAVFCPRSTRWFKRAQWMPVRELLDRGVVVGLGTDSLASNDSLNFLEELRVAEEMLPEVSRQEILRMATLGGAGALGLEVGQIACGMAADLIGFRVEGPPPANWTDVPFDPERTRVDFVMVGGGSHPLGRTYREGVELIADRRPQTGDRRPDNVRRKY